MTQLNINLGVKRKILIARKSPFFIFPKNSKIIAYMGEVIMYLIKHSFVKLMLFDHYINLH